MPDQFPDLPKFPEESRKYEEAMAELDRRAAEGQADIGSWRDWLRHTWPVLAVGIFLVTGLTLVVYTLTNADEVFIAVPGPLLIAFALLCVFLGRRHYRNRPD